MAERNSWAVSDSPNGVITTEDARIAIGALAQPGPSAVSSAAGMRPGKGDPGLVTAASTPNNTVTVQPFQMFMPASRGVGGYVQTLDAEKPLDLLGAHPADPANPRHDLIVAQQADKFYGDTENAFVVRHVVGGASGPPNPVPGSPDYVILANIRIPANARTITPAMIENVRPKWVVGLGGVVPVRTADERNALSVYSGLTAYRQDRRWLETHDGTAWRVPGMPICSSAAEIAATITNPVPGQLAFSTQDNLVYRYDGSAWTGVVATGGVRHEARYEIASGQGQTIGPDNETRINFPTPAYTSPDVTPVAPRTFRLERAGIWSISVSQRLRATQTEDYYIYLAIVNAAPSTPETRYANTMHHYDPNSNPSLNCSTTAFFPAGSLVAALVWMNQGSASHLFDYAHLNNISLTWLRP